MLINIEVNNNIEIRSLNDLFILGRLQEVGSIKVNKSEIARELGVDRRTVSKYIDGYSKCDTRKRGSKIDEYYDVIDYLLNQQDVQVFFYKRVLWQYLVDNHGLNCAQSSFRRWISQRNEFQSYFDGKTNRTVNGVKRDCKSKAHIITYQTGMGEEAQLDWKEELTITLKTGELVTLNVFALVYSFSRFKIYFLSMSKTQTVLFHHLDTAFEMAGGVPKTLRTDNMKTVMDDPRTEYSKGKINNKFAQFAKDYSFEVKPCIAGEPEVKAKVEAPMKLLDELYAYNGLLDLVGLRNQVTKICDRENNKLHSETGKIPILHLQKEKGFLSPLPQDNIRSLYKIKELSLKADSQGFVSYSGKKYSTPIKYCGKELNAQAFDDYLYVYDNTELIVIHQISKDNVKKIELAEHTLEKAEYSLMRNGQSIKEFAENNLKELGEMYK